MEKPTQDSTPTAGYDVEIRDLDAPDGDEVKGGFLGGLVRQVGGVVKTVPPIATGG